MQTKQNMGDKGSVFYNGSRKSWLEKIAVLYSIFKGKENMLLLKDALEL